MISKMGHLKAQPEIKLPVYRLGVLLFRDRVIITYIFFTIVSGGSFFFLPWFISSGMVSINP